MSGTSTESLSNKEHITKPEKKRLFIAELKQSTPLISK